VDFTPDLRAHPGPKLASFASAFDIRNPNGRPPHFLDFDHDGRVNRADMRLMAQEIVRLSAHYYAGFDLSFESGDVGVDTHLGRSTLQDHAPSDHVYVMYVGGTSFDGDPNTFGESFQAPVGYNLENFYGFVHFTTIVHWYMTNSPHADPETFAFDVAETVAHETGHLLGLGHVRGNPIGDTNIMNYNSIPETANIPDQLYPQIDLRDTNFNSFWGPQNPAQEVRASLAGQPGFPTTGLVYATGASSTPGRRDRLDKTTAAEIAGLPQQQRHHRAAGLQARDAVFAAMASINE
jgi:hypothetical protein